MGLSGIHFAGVDLNLEASPAFVTFLRRYADGYASFVPAFEHAGATVRLGPTPAPRATLLQQGGQSGGARASVLWEDEARVLRVALGREDPGSLLLAMRAVRGLVAKILLERGAVAIHASAVAEAGQAFCFLGAKEQGKTTALAASLRRGAAMIANDTVFLEPAAEGTLARGLPVAAGVRQGTVQLFPELVALARDPRALHWENPEVAGEGGKLLIPPGKLARAFGAATAAAGRLQAVVELVLDPLAAAPRLEEVEGGKVALEIIARHRLADPLRHDPALRDALRVDPSPVPMEAIVKAATFRLVHPGRAPIEVPAAIEELAVFS